MLKFLTIWKLTIKPGMKFDFRLPRILFLSKNSDNNNVAEV